MQVLIKKAKVFSPGSKYHLKKKDLLIRHGLIEKIGDNLTLRGGLTIDEKNVMVSAGWMDLFADFCDPGSEHRETLESGMKAAAAGGYTDVCIIPNTQPAITGKAQVDYIRHKSNLVQLHPIGSVSKQLDGKELAEMYDMKLSGAVAFSEGRKPLQHSGLMLKALQYVKTFNGVLIDIPEDTGVSKSGLMHEGVVSTQMGLQGKASISESIQVYRNLELLQYTGSRLHLTGISTKKSVDMIRQAKKQGLKVSCSVTPYHLLYTENDLAGYNSQFKVNPPLRTEEDRRALLKGVEDGTIDAIASHHSPQDWDAKEVEFAYAGEGMITLQTMLPMLLKAGPQIPVERWLEMLSVAPREILNLEIPPIAEGAPACLTVFQPGGQWDYHRERNQSLSQNSPLLNQTLTGKILAVIHHQQIALHE